MGIKCISMHLKQMPAFLSWESNVKFPQKIKNICYSNFTSGYISKGNGITTLKRYLHPYVPFSFNNNSQDMEKGNLAIWSNLDKT